MTDLSRDYMNSAFIPDGDSFYPRWQGQAAAFRDQMAKRSTLNIPYGPGARQAFDLFRPEGMARGLMVFVHGGYWLACGREDYSHLAAGALARVVPISPLADLAPLMQTDMNATLAIDPAEADRESPARLALQAEVQAHVWVGGQERPAFLWQARTLSEAWNCPWTVEAGRHHFDVIDGLRDPNSALMAACLDGL
jgi:hypothetical protein